MTSSTEPTGTRPGRYRKRPVVVDAIRWTGENWPQVREFLNVPANGHGDDVTLRADPTRMPVIIHTLEGDMRAEVGDWIVRGIAGEYYPVKPDIFTDLYEEA